jgi:hypothetical protein
MSNVQDLTAYEDAVFNKQREHRSVKCVCGRKHWLALDDSVCENCGQMFNAFGQKLLPPNQWGEGHDY